MMCRVLMMAMGEVRVVPCCLMPTRFVMLCGFQVVARGMLMVLRGLGVMLCCLLGH